MFNKISEDINLHATHWLSHAIQFFLNFVLMIHVMIGFNPTINFIIRLCEKELPDIKFYFTIKY